MEPIFILAGQSNMVGRCDEGDLPEELRVPSIPISFCWNNDSNFASDDDDDDVDGNNNGAHSNGCWLDLQCQPSPGLGFVNFGPEFGIAHTLAPRLAAMGVRRAHFLKFAMGSTNLHSNWNPDNGQEENVPASQKAHYGRFVHFCRESVEKLRMDGNDNADTATTTEKPILGLFWLQGESDSSKAKDANQYLSNLQTFINAFRADMQVSDLPVVVSPVVWHGKKVKVVNQALKDAGSGSISACVCIDELNLDAFEGGTVVQPAGGTTHGACVNHLTAAAVCDIGKRMGESIYLPEVAHEKAEWKETFFDKG